MIDVKLCDHVGESPSGQKIIHDQWIVFVDDVQVGYLQKSPGAWLQSIVFMDESTKKEVIEAISRRVAADIGGVAMPVDPDLEPQEDDDE